MYLVDRQLPPFTVVNLQYFIFTGIINKNRALSTADVTAYFQTSRIRAGLVLHSHPELDHPGLELSVFPGPAALSFGWGPVLEEDGRGEKNKVFRRAGHWRVEVSGGGSEDRCSRPAERRIESGNLQPAVEVWRARQARNDPQRQWSGAYQQSGSGKARGISAWSGITSHRAGRCRTAMWRYSTWPHARRIAQRDDEHPSTKRFELHSVGVL